MKKMVLVYLMWIIMSMTAIAGSSCEVTQKVFVPFKNPYAHTPLIAVELTNKSNSLLDVSDISIALEGKKGQVLGVMEMLQPLPSVLQPGEKAYAGFTGNLEVEAFAAEVFLNPRQTNRKVTLLETSNVSKIDGGLGSAVISGYVVNSTKSPVNYVKIIAAFLTDDGTLLGIQKGEVRSTIPPGEKRPFQTVAMTFDDKEKGLVEKAEVIKVIAEAAGAPVIF